MSTPRLQLAEVIAQQGQNQAARKKLARQVAAYLLACGQVASLDPLMRDVWTELANQGHVEALAVSAHPLSNQLLANIKTKVRKLYPEAKRIVIKPQFDPEVIGGIRLELPHQQLDLTVEAKLNQFRQLTTAQKGQTA